ncbi:MAG: UDP-glucose 4-epimerase GalE [Chloroflexi bacterium]|nr:UDP-glucose 4-epimerase GalE [Chloroflexota bacterium]
MNIFITGGAGYIGSVTAQALLDAGHTVTVYDSLITGHKAAVPSGAEFIHANLNDLQTLATTLTGQTFDAVIHFAAFIEAGESMKDPGKYFQNNVINSLKLIEFSHQAGIKNFVLSSTAAVYKTSVLPLTEEAEIAPQNAYGQTKLMIEQVLEWYNQIYGNRFAALRYFNAAGAEAGRGEAHNPESHLIPKVLEVALGQRPEIHIFGDDYDTPDGTAIRDYIHIGDLAAAHVLALEGLQKHDRLVYNLGNGTGYSVKEVIDTARQVTGHAIPALNSPRRPGDPDRLVASSELIQKDLSWEPQKPKLEDIIASAWDWHNAHPNGYQES